MWPLVSEFQWVTMLYSEKREPDIQLLSLFPSDPKALYVIFTWDSGAQIYELVAQSGGEKKKWVCELYEAINGTLLIWNTKRMTDRQIIRNPKIETKTCSLICLFYAPVGQRWLRLRLTSWRRGVGISRKEKKVAYTAAYLELHTARECVFWLTNVELASSKLISFIKTLSISFLQCASPS